MQYVGKWALFIPKANSDVAIKQKSQQHDALVGQRMEKNKRWKNESAGAYNAPGMHTK
jgi:hypothetical protein